MFGFSKRRKRARYLKTATRVQAVERRIFNKIRPQFVDRHGDLLGSRLGQAAVDKLFGRAPALTQDDSALAERLAAGIAAENQTIRDAAFISLCAMLELEGENNNFAAERRVVDAIQWLKQFGDMPRNSSGPDALDGISEMFCGRGRPSDNKLEDRANSSLKVLRAAASKE